MSKKQRGQSLFEVVMALAVITLIIVGIASLASYSLRNAVFSKNKTKAARYAQEAIEWLRSKRDLDFEAFREKSLTSQWCLDNLSWDNVGSCSEEEVIPGTVFLRNLSFNTTIKSGKTVIEADVSVKWEDGQGVHEVKSTTYFTDWRER